LKCPKCDKESLDEESSFCAYCGAPFDSKPNSIDLTTGAGILAILAAVFAVAVGFIGVENYISSVAYYSTYYDASTFVGFLWFSIFAFVSSPFGFAGGILTLTRKRFKISVLGTLIMLVSGVFTFIVVWQYQYGFSGVILLAGIPIAALSVISAVFVVKSKTAFA